MMKKIGIVSMNNIWEIFIFSIYGHPKLRISSGIIGEVHEWRMFFSVEKAHQICSKE
jgi:hypothetical protein